MPGQANPAGLGRVALIVGTTTGGTGAHVRMLAAGLSARGIGVCVLGPSSAEDAFGFGARDGVTFSPVEFGDRPRLRDVATVLRLRRLLCPGAKPRAVDRPDVAHAHGLRAGALCALGTVGARGGRRPGLVVTVHNAPPVGGGARGLVYRLLERVVAHRADLVLCVSADLEARLRSAGARRVGRAIVPPPVANSPVPPSVAMASSPPLGVPGEAGRPVVLAVGRLVAQKGFDVLIDAAAHWRDLDPVPLLAIAGAGTLAGGLRARAASLGVDPAFLGQRSDVPELLAAATVFVLPSRWEGQPLALQEALRAGVPIVATRVGGIPDLVGDDAAVLIAPDDPAELAAAVRAILTDDSLASRLGAAATARAAALPTPDDAVLAALVAYTQAFAPKSRDNSKNFQHRNYRASKGTENGR